MYKSVQEQNYKILFIDRFEKLENPKSDVMKAAEVADAVFIGRTGSKFVHKPF